LLFSVTDGSLASLFFKACFSCGEDPSQVPEGNFRVLLTINLSCSLDIADLVGRTNFLFAQKALGFKCNFLIEKYHLSLNKFV
jgi:hypothetical protein